MSTITRAIRACFHAALSLSAVAVVTQERTPIGAEKAGNAAGTIPAFGGSEAPTSGWSFGKYRGDHWAHKDEKPLFAIDASNVDKYADKLLPGQVQLLKTVKGYTMPVYPSHRNCAMPDYVVENTKANEGKAKIAANGWALEEAVLPSVPFPAPKSGIEAIWNLLMRFQGVAVDFQSISTYVSPAPGSDKGILVKAQQVFYFPWAAKGHVSPKSEGMVQAGVYYAYREPAALAGQAIVQRYYFGQDTESFYYFTGQRRVRRLPLYAYDAPLIGFENQLPADASYVFSGNPDRFDWKLVGKKEVYVPYNNFKTANPGVSTSDLLKPSFVSADFRRYELHRVWEIVGTVKEGVRHSSPKKTIYLDEDTWHAMVGDDYDAQGKLWRHKENGVRPAWEAGVCTSAIEYHNYDFVSGRYVADNIVAGGGQDIRVMLEAGTDARLKPSFYTAESLRANSER